MKLTGARALLEIRQGREELFRHFGEVTNVRQDSRGIPVIIHGVITHATGDDDGHGREFYLEVESIEVYDREGE